MNSKKKLIVEDDKDFLGILKIKFESEGFSVVTAEDGASGMRVAGDERPDLIMTDILMPKMDGIEMVRKIRKFDNKALIVFLTNMVDQTSMGDMKDLKDSGGYDYLIKSQLSIADIVEKVKIRLGIVAKPVEVKKEEDKKEVKIVPETNDKPEEVKIKTTASDIIEKVKNKFAKKKIEISVFPIPKKDERK